jgi:DNA repair exonuclease SbcCD ATPase subunit
MITNNNTNKKPRKDYVEYGFYSKVLKQPFDSVDELKQAEAKYYDEQKAKADQAAQKKADAKKVEDAFKALNAARKEYKDKQAQLAEEYSAELAKLKKAFEFGKKDIHDHLAAAEDAYSKALKEFTDKHEHYHLTLKDGDFETTISGCNCRPKTVKKEETDLINLFDLLFGF